MELATSLFGGLGLFLLGIRGIGSSLQQLVGRRLRALVARATAGPGAASVAGLALGALTQSSSAATVIVTSLVTAHVLPVRRSLPVLAWVNAGTSVLVILATFDLRLAVLWLVGAVGFATFFNLDRDGKLRPVLGALVGLALLFLGLDVLKDGADLLGHAEMVRDALHLAGGTLLLPFLVGLLVTLAAQSSSTITILATTLLGVGLMTFEQTVMAVYGASLGGGLSGLLIARGLQGSARQPLIFQALFKALGTTVFLALFALEHWGGVPLVLHLLAAISDDGAQRIGWLFLLFQVATALLLLPVFGPVARLLNRLAPPGRSEALARPQFLYDLALDDPPTALALVEREQQRLFQRLAPLLDEVREDARAAELGRTALASAGDALERAVAAFLGELLGRGCPRESMERLVLLEARGALLTSLREAVGDFAATVEQARNLAPGAPVAVTLARLAESLHLLLLQLGDAAGSGDEEAVAMLRDLTADRGEMMAGLRRRIAAAQPDLDYALQDLLFRGTALFERAVWLTRRTTTLLTEAPSLVLAGK